MAVDLRPDLVLLDLGLPDIDGTEVLAMLRAVSQVPVIIASARDDDPSLVKALDAGADDYVDQAVHRRPARRPDPRGAAPGGRRPHPSDDRWSSGAWRSTCAPVAARRTARSS